MLFIAQSFPQIVSIVPLFVLFAKFNLVDNLFGLAIVYVSITISVATWMMAAYIDTIPVALEEAAWIDGCSLFGGFVGSSCATRCPASCPPLSSPSSWPGVTS